jgi:DNA-binding response OmpR family regulator
MRGPYLNPADATEKRTTMSRTLLLIDDGVNFAPLIERITQELLPELRVSNAKTGKEGLQKARAEAPDLILLDIKLPDINGYEVCRKLRADPRTRHVPILMISGVARSEGDVMKGRQAGADDYMFKPFVPAELVARIRALLSEHRTPPPLQPVPWFKKMFHLKPRQP